MLVPRAAVRRCFSPHLPSTDRVCVKFIVKLQYLQQLAIITPYAQLELEYHNHANPKKDLTAVYRRRSEQMPPLAYEVKHHPGSVNNLLVQQLIHRQATHPWAELVAGCAIELPRILFFMLSKLFRTRILHFMVLPTTLPESDELEETKMVAYMTVQVL